MYSHKIPEWMFINKRIQNKKIKIFTEYQSGWLALASQSKSPNVPKWVKMSLVFSWRVIIPALTQLLFQFKWTVTDIYCSRCWDEYESSFLIILESLKSHLHLRRQKKRRKRNETKKCHKGSDGNLYHVIQTSKNSFPEFQNIFFSPESIC